MHKTMVFTVADMYRRKKPIVWAQLTSDGEARNQREMERMITEWLDGEYNPGCRPDMFVSDIASEMITFGSCMPNNRWCFEITEVFG